MLVSPSVSINQVTKLSDIGAPKLINQLRTNLWINRFSGSIQRLLDELNQRVNG